MIQAILASAGALAAGVLLGGCTNRDADVTDALLERNSQLESQISSTQNVVTGLGVTLVLMACGLGVAVYRTMQRKEKDIGQKTKRKRRAA